MTWASVFRGYLDAPILPPLKYFLNNVGWEEGELGTYIFETLMFPTTSQIVGKYLCLPHINQGKSKTVSPKTMPQTGRIS